MLIDLLCCICTHISENTFCLTNKLLIGDIPIYTVNISLQMVHTSYKWSKYLFKNERLTFLKSWHGLLTTEIN